MPELHLPEKKKIKKNKSLLTGNDLIPAQEAVPENPTRDLFQIMVLILVCLLIVGGIVYCMHQVDAQVESPEYDSNK